MQQYPVTNKLKLQPIKWRVVRGRENDSCSHSFTCDLISRFFCCFFQIMLIYMWLCFTNNVHIFCFPHTKTQSDFQRKTDPPSPKSLAKRLCRLVWSKNISSWSCCGQVGMDLTICCFLFYFLFRAAEGHTQEKGWLRISCWCKQTVLEMLFKSVWL